MGFPEWFAIPIRAEQSGFYKQIGNAACPPIIAAIAESLVRVLGLAGTRIDPTIQATEHVRLGVPVRLALDATPERARSGVLDQCRCSGRVKSAKSATK